ncbi:MAG: class I SAM-dependent methyltransferase, partial [Nannocystaceae bacterium]
IFDLSIEDVVVKRRRRQRGDAQYERMERSGERIQVTEGEAKILVNLRDYLDTGLFLDHRPIRRWIGEHVRGKRFLNLFCYTGVVTVHAAIGGARETTSVDLSARYLDWAADNLRLNRCSPRTNALIRDDVMVWMDDAAERGERWDLLFIDPPTFSNSKRMEGTFDVQRDHEGLLRKAAVLCAPGGEIIFSTNSRRFKISEALEEVMKVEDVTEWSLPPDFSRQRRAHHCYRLYPRG